MIVSCKSMIIRILFGIELFLFVYIIVYGKHGIINILKMNKANQEILWQLQAQEKELASIKKSIATWHNEPFLKEKIAREKLGLVCKGDTVYYTR